MAKRDRTIIVRRGSIYSPTMWYATGMDGEELGKEVMWMQLACSSRATDRTRFACFTLQAGKRKYDLIVTPAGAELKEVKHGKA